MDGPGYSLFHGGDSIRPNNSDIDEEEELQRHKSIEKGLNDFLGDDLLGFDETEASITHSNIYKHHDQDNAQDESYMEQNHFYGRIQSNNQNNYSPLSHKNQQMHHNVDHYDNSEEISRLRHALESKTREVDHFKEKCMVESKRSDELQKRLKLSEAEKERALMQKKQFHELLVEGKGRCNELEEEISNLKMKIKNLETNNTQLVCELDNTKTLMSDLQLKYRIIEKDVHSNRQVDSVLKQENDRHTAQAYLLQQEMNSLRNQLENKDLEVKNLQARYKELQKSRSSIVEEHSDQTRQLQREIDENQRCNANTSYENLQLKKTIQSLERENSEMQRTLHQLTLRCEKSKSRTDSDRLNASNNDESFEYFKKNRSSLVGSTPINTNDEINRLKKELDCTINALESSRQKIESLEQQLQLKIVENKQLKDDENNALVQMVEYKDECQRLNGKLCLLDGDFKHNDALEHQKQRLEELQDQIDELQKINDEFSIECEKLRSYNEQLIKEKDEMHDKYNDAVQNMVDVENLKRELNKQTILLDDARKECDRLKEAHAEIKKAKDQVADELAELNDVRKELHDQNQKVSSLENALKMTEWKCTELEKRGYDKMHDVLVKEKTTKNLSCSKCIDQKTTMTKLEVENLELRNFCANHIKEITDLKESNTNLSNVVEMKKEHDIMLNELKCQAKELADLVNTQNTKNTAAMQQPKVIESRDQSVSTTPDLDYHSEPLTRRDIETKMSKIMSAKVKQIENESVEQMQEIVRSVELLTGELQKAHSDIKMREKEVELLKLTLLAERKVSTDQIAKLKLELNSNSRNLLVKLQNENQMLKKELDDRNEIEMTERESMEVLKKQWNDQQASLVKDIQNLKNVIAEFETEKSQIIKRLNKKYESAVKRGDNYRDYAEAKEQHIISESARIREEYQNKLSKMQSKYLEKLESIFSRSKRKSIPTKLSKSITSGEKDWRSSNHSCYQIIWRNNFARLTIDQSYVNCNFSKISFNYPPSTTSANL